MPTFYGDIVVDISTGDLDRIFQYRIPDELLPQIEVGMQVRIPFGKNNRMITGFLINLTEHPRIEPERIKPVENIVNSELAVESQLIKLAWWMKETYGSTMLQALKTVIPVRKQIRHNEKKYYRLKICREDAENLLQKSRKDKRLRARVRLLEALLKEECISRNTLANVLEIKKQTLDGLMRQDVVEEIIETTYRRAIRPMIRGKNRIALNEEQRHTVNDICNAMDLYPQVHLIHGVTGSGKTEVYMELIEHTISKGQQVIVLIPEISLTLQTVSRFYVRFGERISIMNSRLSQGEKYDQYLRAKRGDVDIIIGPRSALFMPFKNLGLIIIDEEHDGAYKSEKTPRYHARETAIQWARMQKASVVLGSATPSVDSYTKALAGEYVLHELSRRAVCESEMPTVKVLDLREEFRSNNKSIFSRELKEKIEERLRNREQIMLFLNRRGYAGFVSCRECGYVFKCRHCDVSLTYHKGNLLKCHYCGYEQPMADRCPECGSKYVAAFGTGTQKVEELVRREFKEARVLRMDRDSTSKKDSMDKILETFSSGEADILVGTQMIVKGHDFPNVTLVGILVAHLSMFSNDYMACERTFALLTQAAGRAGRGTKAGEVIIQTYNPEHYSIVAAAKQDYKSFYDHEIIYRKLMRYPPMVNMMAVLAESSDANAVADGMKKLDCILKAEGALAEHVDIIGPANAKVQKSRDIYRKVLYIKCESLKILIQVRHFLEGYVEYSSLYKNVSIQFDLNPMTTY